MNMTEPMQLCAWIRSPGEDDRIEMRSIDIPKPATGQLLVKLEFSGLCHSDLHSIYGNTPIDTNIVGHAGVGEVVAVGPNVGSANSMNRRVGVSWLHKTCGQCDTCTIDRSFCPFQDNTGRNVPGTFQQYCLADAEHVTYIPDGLSAEDAAPLLCGGVTMYGALRRADLRPGDFVIIPGGGGGLGHLGIQLAVLRGLRVIAVDSGEDKKTLCMSLGAEHFIDHAHTPKTAAEVHRLTGQLGAHGVICASGSPMVYDKAIAMLRPCGKLICVGIPPANYRMPISPFEMVVRGLHIVGSWVGTQQDMDELMALAAQGKVKAVVDRHFTLSELPTAIDRLREGKIAGRALVHIS